jgi:signal transduction histidine kinase
MPTSVAYQPVTSVLWLVSAVILTLVVISLALAYAFSKGITDSMMGLYTAARNITNHQEYKQHLPLKRRDEIGQVAVCIDKMAQRIEEDREEITAERDRAEEEKKRSELYLDIMGHDINNLNQSILGNLELIQDEANLTDKERESIVRSISSALSSSTLISNVRKLQQISEATEAEVVDINDKILECIREAHRPGDKKVTINYSPHKGMMCKCGHLVKEAFCNLINNSVKHSGPEVTIDIEAVEAMIGDKKYYSVTVSDDGPGIPDEVKPRLFNRFQRGETKAHGKGLGLYIVRSVLEKCGGSVKVEDRVPGDYTKGVRFMVMLPAIEK